MGTRRKRRRQEALWVATTDLPQTVAHPFYRRVNALLDAHGFDTFVERQCQRFYAATRGRPSLTPGIYFRALLVGYFEGIDSERGIAWRAADSLAIRRFLGIAVDEDVPDHSTISRTRRLIDVETHRAVFTWVQQRLIASGVLKGATIGIDATTLEANAAMRSIVRRDTGEDYQAYLTGLAQASGIATPTRDDLARLDRKRKKTTSNKDWRSPVDPDAKVAKMKDGRTHLAHKVEHAVDLDTGAVVAVTVQGADTGDTTTIGDTTVAAADQIEDAQAEVDDPQAFTALVADKGYHSNEVMVDLQAVGVRSYVAEPDRGRRDWSKAREAQAPVYANRRRIRGARGKRLMRRRGERIERSFAHAYETGGMRAHASARASQYLEAPLDSPRGLQPRRAVPAADRRWHAAQPAGALSRRADGPCVLLAAPRTCLDRSRARVPRAFHDRGRRSRSITHPESRIGRPHFHHGLLMPASRAVASSSVRNALSA